MNERLSDAEISEGLRLAETATEMGMMEIYGCRALRELQEARALMREAANMINELSVYPSCIGPAVAMRDRLRAAAGE